MSPWANVKRELAHFFLSLSKLSPLLEVPGMGKAAEIAAALTRKRSCTAHIVSLCCWSRAWFSVVTLDG